MDVVRFSDPRAFRDATEAFLLEDEARHNVLLGVTTTLIERPDVYPEFRLWMVEHRGEPVAVASHTPPFNLAVSRPGAGGALASLAQAIRTEGIDLPGVVGAVPEVDEFRMAWESLEAGRARLGMEQRIYRLVSVRPVADVPGRMRDGSPADRDLLIEWIRAFADEALGQDTPSTDPARLVDLRLEGGGAGLVLWVHPDGRPASLAGFGGRTPHGARVGPVYTPPELRRQGYASALVAALSGRLLEEGRSFCFLYTDLSNPTSNSIYQTVGYEPVGDSREYRFEGR